MSAPVDPEDYVILAVNGEHAMFVGVGFETDDSARQCSLDQPALVEDRDGWFTLHRVMGIRRRAGRRIAVIGPRVPWPDGSTAARKLREGGEA